MPLVEITYGFGEVFLYDESRSADGGGEIEAAIARAAERGEPYGVAGASAVVMMPMQYGGVVPLQVEVHDAAPPLGNDAPDMRVEFDFALPTGVLLVEEPACEPVRVPGLPSGACRLRWSSYGFAALDAWEAGLDDDPDAEAPPQPDHYRLEIWAVSDATAPVVLASHPRLA